MKHIPAMIILAACCILSACGGKKDVPMQASKPPTAVDSAMAATSEIIEGIDVTGSLEPKFWADVKTQIPGLVKEVYVTEWVRVHKGQKLARIDIEETEALMRRAEASLESAKASLAQVQVSASRADRELSRVQKLKESGLATQQALDDARTESDAARTRIDAAKAQLRASEEELKQVRTKTSKSLIVAPADGVISHRSVNVGDLTSDAAAAAPIFRIVDNRLLNLTVTVPSADAARIKKGQPLEFSVDALPGRTFSGRVMFINPELSASDRSMKVIAEVRNEDELLKGGLFAKGRIISGKKSGVVQVPRSALGAWDTSSSTATIFVIQGDSSRIRKVKTGTVNGDQVEVVDGLKPGELYVTRGSFNLKDGDRISSAPPTK